MKTRIVPLTTTTSHRHLRLLDQTLLPGCGNIIKTEACARARLDPRRPVASLSVAELSCVVGHVRAFSLTWATKGAKPPRIWYDQVLCGACGARLRFQKLGDDAERPSFWCPACCEASAADASARTDATTAGGGGSEPTAPRRAVEPSRKRARCDERFACGAHGESRTSLKRTRKAGANVGRLFFSCRVPACAHFAWADARFPRCRCGGGGGTAGKATARAPTAVARLRVSKRPDSGGRWFFGCGDADAKRRCDFFEWASDAQLEPLGALLTPLT